MRAKRILTATVPVLLLLALGTSSVARAADKIKIGYVDLQRAISETEEGKKAKTHLKGVFDKKQAELKKEEEALKKAKEEYDAKALLMTPENRAKAEQELQQKFAKLQQTLRKHQVELSKKEAEVMKKILGKMERILAQVGKAQGFTVILNKGDGNLLWAEPSLDLTNEIIRRYNDSK